MLIRIEKKIWSRLIVAVWLFSLVVSKAVAGQNGTGILPQASLAARYFGNDAPWFEKNIPFFDCSDPQITGFITIGGSFTGRTSKTLAAGDILSRNFWTTWAGLGILTKASTMPRRFTSTKAAGSRTIVIWMITSTSCIPAAMTAISARRLPPPRMPVIW